MIVKVFNWTPDDKEKLMKMKDGRLHTDYVAFEEDDYENLLDLIDATLYTTLFHRNFYHTADDQTALNFMRSNAQASMYQNLNEMISCGIFSEDSMTGKSCNPQNYDINYCDRNAKREEDKCTDTYIKDTYRSVAKPIKKSAEVFTSGVGNTFRDSARDVTSQIPDVPVQMGMLTSDNVYEKMNEEQPAYIFQLDDVDKNCKVVGGKVYIDGHRRKGNIDPDVNIKSGKIRKVAYMDNGEVIITADGKKQIVKNKFIFYNNKDRYFMTMNDWSVHMKLFNNVTLYEHIPSLRTDKTFKRQRIRFS
jgi:hypothetical protein